MKFGNFEIEEMNSIFLKAILEEKKRKFHQYMEAGKSFHFFKMNKKER
jgi:hypothetical protein